MEIGALIDDPADLNSERLTEILRPASGRVLAVEATPGPVTMPSVCTYLSLTYSDDAVPGLPTRLFFKLSNPENPPFEVEFYAELAERVSDPPFVECYHAGYDEDIERYHLLLRDASDTHLTPNPPSEWVYPTRHQTLSLAAGFARVHAAFWDGTAPAEPWGDELGEFVREEYETTDEQVGAFLDRAQGRFDGESENVLRQVALQVQDLILKRVQRGENLALHHGDANIWNAVYPKSEADPVLLIDWVSYKRWKRWIGAFDLANHIARFWHPWTRKRFEGTALENYWEMLRACGVGEYGWKEFLDDYRLGVLSVVNDGLYVPAAHRLGRADRIAENAIACFEDHHCQDLLD